jgi:hypothetical protein
VGASQKELIKTNCNSSNIEEGRVINRPFLLMADAGIIEKNRSPAAPGFLLKRDRHLAMFSYLKH